MTNPNSYNYWHEELANPGCNPRDTDRRDISGFYRIAAAATKPDYSLAIWELDGVLNAKIGQTTMITEASDDDWFDFMTSSWLKTKAETHESYGAAVESGYWPEDQKPARRVSIGHNTQTGDPHTDLTVEFEGERELADEFLKSPIDNQEKADKAAVWSKRLSQIAKKAVDQHKVEKQPHLDAGRAVDDKWRSLKDDPKVLSTRLKRHLDSWLREQARIEEERRKLAEAEAEAKRMAAEQANNPETAERLSEEAQQAESDAKEQNAAAGRTGARVSLRTFTTAEITDYEKLLEALKDRREVKELVQSLANRAAKSGVDLPGMKIIEEKRAA